MKKFLERHSSIYRALTSPREKVEQPRRTHSCRDGERHRIGTVNYPTETKRLYCDGTEE